MRPEHNLRRSRGRESEGEKKKKKKDNMSSSLPAFNQLQLSFPQLEAKTHWGEGEAEPNQNKKL